MLSSDTLKRKIYTELKQAGFRFERNAIVQPDFGFHAWNSMESLFGGKRPPLPPLYVRSQDLVRCAITVTVLHPSLPRPQKPGPRLRRYPTLTSRLGYVAIVLRRDHPHDHGLRQLDS